MDAKNPQAEAGSGTIRKAHKAEQQCGLVGKARTQTPVARSDSRAQPQAEAAALFALTVLLGAMVMCHG